LVTIADWRLPQVEVNFSHDDWPGTTAEVLAWNSGYDDPAATAVAMWKASPEHWAILSNPYWARIGCASGYSGGKWYFVCELWPAAAKPIVRMVPNTAFR